MSRNDRSHKNPNILDVKDITSTDELRLDDSKPDIDITPNNLPARVQAPQQNESWYEPSGFASNPDIVSSVWSFPEASPSARVAAFVIDTVLLTVAFGLLDAVFERLTDDVMPRLLQGIATILYFAVSHGLRGQTFGKKFVGIKVLPLEASSQGIPFGRLLLRESIGRSISLLLFGYGYIRILMRKDRMGLHDTLARTRVASLSLDRATASTISVKAFAGGVGLVIAVLAIAFYWTMNHTAHLVRQSAKRLEALGIHTEGISGSPSRGYTIAKVSFQSKEFSVVLEGVEFNFEIREGEENEFVLGATTVRTARIFVHRWPDSRRAEDPTKTSPTGPFGESPERGQRRPIAFAVTSFDVGELEVQVPGRPAYRAERAMISDLKWRPSVKTWSLSRFYLESDSLSLDVGDLILQDQMIAVNRPALVQLRPSLMPEIIKSPIDVQFEGIFEDFRPTRLTLAAFSKKLNVKWQGESGELTLNGFTPLHYFNTALPIWNVDFRLIGDFKRFSVERMNGSVGLRNVRFELEAAGLGHTRGTRHYTLTPRLQAEWKSLLAGKDAGFILGTSDKLYSREAVAQLYFGRTLSLLQPNERAMVDADSRFLTDTADAGQAPVIVPIVTRVVAPTPARAPTSAVRKRGVPAGVPTVLPAYSKRKK